jgi:hypothetical protein
MKDLRKAVVASAVVLFVMGAGFCACSSASLPPPSGSSPGSGDGGSADRVSSSPEGSTSSESGTAEGSASDAPHDGVAPVDGGDGGSAAEAGDAGVPVPPAAVCDPNATWATGQVLSISTASDDELDAVTPNELSIVWTAGTALLYADRTSATDTFGAPQTVPAGSFSTARVAMSADGLRLVVVNGDGQGFSELTRTASGGTFGAPAQGTYGNLDAAGALASGESYGDPVLSADDHTFYYSVYGGGLTATIFKTTRLFAGDSWQAGAAIAASTDLTAQGSMRRQPTGLSSDEQTLFFWDQVLGSERAGWLDEKTGAFDMFVDLGARAMAAPNTACTELYYSAAGASSVDLFIAGH